jgi:hypothetical protein
MSETPAARAIPKHWIIILVVGLVLCASVLVCGGAGALWLVFMATRAVTQPRGLDDPRVTQDTFEDVEAEMTLGELEARLGPGRKVSFEELPLADGQAPGKQDRAQLEELSRKYRIKSWYLWTGNNRWVFAGFRVNRSSIVGKYWRNSAGEWGISLDDREDTLP